MKKLIEQMDGYQTEVKVYVSYPGDKDFDWKDKTVIKYDIDVEHRSWGLKGITLSFSKPFEVEVWERDGDGNVINERTIEVDPKDMNISWKAGSLYSPVGVDVYLNEDLSIRSVDIECAYINPDEV